MLNQWLRYIPVACLLKEAAYPAILEVGGGARGIDRYLTGPTVVSVDLYTPARTGERGRLVLPVRGTAHTLPFRDNAFPAVVCIDMLEHIAPDSREAVIRELVRVASGKVYLAFPVRESYGAWEERILGCYSFFGKKVPQWLCEHRQYGLPMREEIARFFSVNGIAYQMIPNENNLIHFLAMIVDESFLSRLVTALVDYMAPDRWPWKAHTVRQNSARALCLPFRRLPRFLNFGSTVRTLFILSKP